MTPALQDSGCLGVGAKHYIHRVNKDLQTLNLTKENEDMLKSFLKDETGVELAEYAVAAALIVAIALVVYKTLGNAVNTANSTTGSKMQNPTFP
jgi:Flp pilus assembly pilin Flp